MSNTHVNIIEGNRMRLVCHIPIPAGSNLAGVSWQTALVNAKMTTPTVLVLGDGTNGTIDNVSANNEASQLTSGALVEEVCYWDPGPDWSGLTAGQKQAKVDAKYNALKNEVQQRLQNQLNYLGFTR